MLDRLLTRIVLGSARNWRRVLVVGALVVALSGALAARLEFDTDVLNLLPKKDPAINQFLDAMERFGSVDYLLVAVWVPEGAVVEPYAAFVDRLGGRLEALPEMAQIEYRLGAPEELLESLFPHAVLFLDEDGRRELAARVSPEGVEARAGELRRLVATPQALAVKDLLKLDPFGFAEIFLGRLEETRGELSVDWTSGYYLSQDQRMLLLLGEPVKPPQDTEFDQQLVDAVDAATAATLAEWEEIAGPGLEPPSVDLGGPYLTALDDYRMIRGDIVKNILTSTVFVLALFLLAFRRLGPLLYAIVPLASGLVATFGFSAVTVGTLSSATSGTAALLIGLGIDFVIVSYGRYVEERRGGGDEETALAAMARTSGRAVVVGAVTTAATFYAFLVTDFTGLRQMGFLTGTGILFCMVAVLTLLPALLAWGEERHRRRASSPNLYLHSFGAGGLIRFAAARPRLTLVLGLLVTLAAAAGAFGLEFEEGMKSMRPEEGNRGIAVGEKVAEHFDSGFDKMMLVVRGDDLDEVFEHAEAAAAGAEELVEEGILLGYSGLTSFVPSPARQAEALVWLAAERAAGRLDADRVESDFRRALAEQGMRAEPFERGLDLFRQAVSPQRPMAPEDFAADPDAAQLLERYLQRDGDGWVAVVYLYPPLNRWRREPPPQALEVAERLGPDVVLTGPNVVNQRMRSRARRDAVVAAVLGLVLVWGLLWLDFRRPGDALLALVPLLVGMVWMLGGMALFDLKLNFMNVFVTTMIIGIGVDYGLHAVHRWREAASAGEAGAAGVVETGKAIMVAALSTVVGFGSMATSVYPGLRSTGYMAILGALATALVAITLLPAYLSLRRGRGEK